MLMSALFFAVVGGGLLDGPQEAFAASPERSVAAITDWDADQVVSA